MKIKISDIVKLTGLIAATGLTGGGALALAPAIGLGSTLIPKSLGFGDDPQSKEELRWMQTMVDDWMEICEKLMSIPMNPEVKANTLKGKIRSDFFRKYVNVPKESKINDLHRNVLMAVKGKLAVAGLIED